MKLMRVPGMRPIHRSGAKDAVDALHARGFDDRAIADALKLAPSGLRVLIRDDIGFTAAQAKILGGLAGVRFTKLAWEGMHAKWTRTPENADIYDLTVEMMESCDAVLERKPSPARKATARPRKRVVATRRRSG